MLVDRWQYSLLNYIILSLAENIFVLSSRILGTVVQGEDLIIITSNFDALRKFLESVRLLPLSVLIEFS